jgi:hypothetical protein
LSSTLNVLVCTVMARSFDGYFVGCPDAAPSFCALQDETVRS